MIELADSLGGFPIVTDRPVRVDLERGGHVRAAPRGH
jgi:hypothetical protein